jgi:transcriptional regulator with XRE-family HTH domain
MEKYIIEQKKKIGKKFYVIRTALKLSENEFAILTKVSPNTIRNIESGVGFNSNSILSISFFLGIPISELLDLEVVNLDFQIMSEQFWDRVKKYNKDGMLNYNKKRISIKELLITIISDTDYFNESRQVKDIVKFLREEYKIEASSSIVSQTLSNLEKNNTLKRKILNGVRNYWYFK